MINGAGRANWEITRKNCGYLEALNQRDSRAPPEAVPAQVKMVERTIRRYTQYDPRPIITSLSISGVLRNLKGGGSGTFQVYIFKSGQILAYFFTLNITTKFFSLPKGGQVQAYKGPPKHAPAIDLS